MGNYTSYLILFLVSTTIGSLKIIKKYYKIQSLNNFHDSFAHETYNKTDEKEMIVIFKNSKNFLL